MNELMSLDFNQQTISARELHERLNIKSKYADWFRNMLPYGFTEGIDFVTVSKNLENGGRTIEHQISIDMAKELCMIQRTPEGKQVRQYLMQIEKAWNTPEMVMARALKMAQKTIEQKDEIILRIEAQMEEMKPKAIFADAVAASDTSILIRDFAKILKQNGVDTGEKRFYKWLRQNGYIVASSTRPTQRAMNMGLFEIIESTVQRADLPPLTTMTTKITGKGQQYFINKFLGEKK